MKVAVISGSRNPSGQTGRAVSAVMDGLSSAGCDCQVSFLPALSIERCRQCDEQGWGICRSEGRCVIEDDFAGLMEQIRAAGAVAFATPVYFGDLSESLRAFLDRLRRVTWHRTDKKEITGKPAIGICVAGGGGGGAPSCALSLEKILHHCGFDVVDMIPVRRQNLMMRLSVLNATGKWLATGPTSK